jgi:hypothetical protein
MEMDFRLPILSKTAFAVIEIVCSIRPATSFTM